MATHGHHQSTIFILAVTLGSVSILSSLAVILLHAFFRAPHRRLNDPVLWLSVACLFAPLSNMEIGSMGPWSCWFEAMANQFFYLASFFWVTCIGHQLYRVILHSATPEDDTYMPTYHAVSWGLPALSVVILSFIGGFDTEKSSGTDWCWVSSTGAKIVFFYIPLVAMLFINAVVYLVIIVTIYRRYTEALDVGVSTFGEQRPMHFARQTMSWGLRASIYLIVFVLTRMGSLANRIHQVLHGGRSSTALRVLHTVTVSIQGLLYALVYVYNERVLGRLKEARQGVQGAGLEDQESVSREFMSALNAKNGDSDSDDSDW
mmetsp:Transcript_20475/g.54614  ORF Transcript_20475/g.54614 Transcript_20475/m.54614 type:complete len:318 (-) Transcript_20475:133-1086(-)